MTSWATAPYPIVGDIRERGVQIIQNISKLSEPINLLQYAHVSRGFVWLANKKLVVEVDIVTETINVFLFYWNKRLHLSHNKDLCSTSQSELESNIWIIYIWIFV